MDIVSSVCFLLLTSSDKLNDFWGEPVPTKTRESLTAHYSSFKLATSVQTTNKHHGEQPLEYSAMRGADHRMVWVGSDLSRPSSPSPLQ